jgi:histidinol-phosphate aminotransferase
MSINTEKIAEVIKLSQNENPFGASPKALKAIEEHISSVFRYPDLLLGVKLQHKLAEKHNVAPENIVISAGSVSLIDMSIKAFVGFEENVVTTQKTFVAYGTLSKINRRESKFAKLVDNTVNLDNILALCDDRTRLLFIANPNNPTGTLISHDPFKKFLEKVPSTIIVGIDEAYVDYVSDPSYPDSFELQKHFPNLVILRTFSKVYGLAGLRIGYAVANADVIKALEHSRTPFSVISLAAIGALAALDDTEYIQDCIAINEKERDYLYRELTGLGFKVTPSQANFLLVEFDNNDDKEDVYNLLVKKGILVRRLEPFGVEKGLRIGIGRPEDNRLLIEILKQA